MEINTDDDTYMNNIFTFSFEVGDDDDYNPPTPIDATIFDFSSPLQNQLPPTQRLFLDNVLQKLVVNAGCTISNNAYTFLDNFIYKKLDKVLKLSDMTTKKDTKVISHQKVIKALEMIGKKSVDS